MWLRSQGKSIKPSSTALRSFLQEVFGLKLFLLWLTIVIYTSLKKLEVKVNKDPRLWDVSVFSLQISTWNFYTPSDHLTRTAWIRRVGQECKDGLHRATCSWWRCNWPNPAPQFWYKGFSQTRADFLPLTHKSWPSDIVWIEKNHSQRGDLTVE